MTARTQGELSLKGHVEEDVAALFVEQLASLTPADAPVRIVLSQAKLADERVVTMLAEHIHQTARRVGSIEVIGAPTALRAALAHAEDGRPRLEIIPGSK